MCTEIEHQTVWTTANAGVPDITGEFAQCPVTLEDTRSRTTSFDYTQEMFLPVLSL